MRRRHWRDGCQRLGPSLVLGLWLLFSPHVVLAQSIVQSTIQTGTSADAQPSRHVVATLKPIHSLVAAVMDGIGQPYLLVRDGASPHTSALRPSDARALQEARLVFWIGPTLEVFLADSLVTLAVDAQIVTLLDASEMVLWPMRRSGVWSAPHDADSDEDGLSQAHDRAQGEAGPDPHVWLDPTNAQSMTAAIVAALQTVDPANSEAYAVNGAAVIARLARLERQMESALAPVRAAPFVVFHDAYQYLERRFYLQALGAITIGPEVQPGAARIRDTQLLIRSRDARCVFAEPQFEPQIVRVVIEGTTVPWGVLDPLGENLVAGPDLYVQLMERMTNAVVACLSTP